MLGVAISASLLPPAVNTGLFWAMAMMSYSFDDSIHHSDNQTDISVNIVTGTTMGH